MYAHLRRWIVRRVEGCLRGKNGPGKKSILHAEAVLVDYFMIHGEMGVIDVSHIYYF